MNKNVVDILKLLLESAERGQIVSIAVATIRDDRGSGSAFAGDRTLTELLGSIELMKHRLIETTLKEETKPPASP